MHFNFHLTRRPNRKRHVTAQILEAMQADETAAGRWHRTVKLEHFRSNAHAREAVNERLEEGALAGQEVDGVVFR